MNLKMLAGSFVAAMSLSSLSHALLVSPENNGVNLANTILGSGISISNVAYSGASGASGVFSGGATSGLDIDKGVVLSTGSAVGAAGANTINNYSVEQGAPGYAPLTALSGNPTYDATRLKFDFTFTGGLGGDLNFNFIFGSEEYLKYVGTQYNDVFAFYVDGVNVALTPVTLSPITINTINPAQNAGLFVDNATGAYATQMNGFTRAMQINLKDLSSGQHTMEFAIADAGDAQLDSWIFVQAESFSNIPTPTTVPEPGPLALFAAGLLAVISRRKFKK